MRSVEDGRRRQPVAVVPGCAPSFGVHVDRASVLSVLWEVVTVGAVVTEIGPLGREYRTALLGHGAGDGWRVRVTGGDVRDAWDAWLAARDGGAPPDRVQDLRDDLDRLVRATAQQRHDDARRLAVTTTRAE